MSSNFDVFGGLNNYLENADDDSFKYSPDPTNDNISDADSSLIAAKTPEANNPKNDEVIDLSKIEIAASKKDRRRAKKTTAIEANESFDLTNVSSEILRPKISRRSADGIPVMGTIELPNGDEAPNKSAISNQTTTDNDSSLNESPLMVTRQSRRRGKVNIPPKPKPAKAPKLPKAKRMTYKQALALIDAPIPQSPETLAYLKELKKPSQAIAPAALLEHPVYAFESEKSCNRKSKKNRLVTLQYSAPAQAPQQQPSWDVDLTGEISMSDKHSSAPLFQKQVNAALAVEEDSDDDSDFDKIRVKVKTLETIKAYPLRRHQRFYDLFKIISEQHNIQQSNMFIFDGEKRVHPHDTPHSISYKISTILTCRLMESKESTTFQQLVKENQIELKFQSDKWKKPLVVTTSKVDNFKTAIEILCEKVPFTPNQITLRFDGDSVDLRSTPMDLDFEGGEILDCAIKV